MSIKIHQAGYEHAVSMIKNGLEVEHTTNWLETRPTPNDEAHFLATHDLDEYGNWFLGISHNLTADGRAQFFYPFGDFNVLHVSALIAIKEDAERQNNIDIQTAVEKLLALL